jgi:hypothetical protein
LSAFEISFKSEVKVLITTSQEYAVLGYDLKKQRSTHGHGYSRRRFWLWIGKSSDSSGSFVKSSMLTTYAFEFDVSSPVVLTIMENSSQRFGQRRHASHGPHCGGF